ncbi:hypothetical protein [Streptomyces sp. DH12]|uniref:hypothetical protein n=1 Tax=Streptomyces sp. DH12 TaxID=2857010 RepID=UPI001E4EFBBE|nr:hypothetical protein [Streptomyces sp. DH12]
MEKTKITVEARYIRRGDTFERHRRTWTATQDAYRRGPWGSVEVVTERGVVWFSNQEEPIVVTRGEGPACTA